MAIPVERSKSLSLPGCSWHQGWPVRKETHQGDQWPVGLYSNNIFQPTHWYPATDQSDLQFSPNWSKDVSSSWLLDCWGNRAFQKRSILIQTRSQKNEAYAKSSGRANDNLYGCSPSCKVLTASFLDRCQQTSNFIFIILKPWQI